MNIVERIGSFWKTVILEYIHDGCTIRAAALAFTTLLSIVPLMAVSFSVLAAFPLFKGMATEIQSFIFQNFVASSANAVLAHLQTFAKQAAQLSATGFLFLLFTAVLMVFNMEQAFNAIWRVKRQRHGVSAFLLYWGVITLLPILIGVGLAMSSYVMALPVFKSAKEFEGVKLLLFYAPFVIIWVAFTLINVAMPNCKVSLRYAMVGAIVSALFFEISRFGFTWYVTNLSVYRHLYGTLATIPIFLIWIFLAWAIILFGAVVNRVLEEGARKQTAQ